MSARALAAALLVLAGCGGGESSGASRTVVAVANDAVLVPIGQLGVLGGPSAKTVSFDDPADGTAHHTGGFVVSGLDEGSLLGARDVGVGDVIVRVGGNDVPNKEDPTLDLVALFEEEVSGGVEEITIGIVRKGKLRSVTVTPRLDPLEVGFPAAIERFRDAAVRGTTWLASAQQDDGSFATAGDTSSARVTVTAAAGLAFLASGAGEEGGSFSERLDLCRTRTLAALEEADTLDPWAASFATLFLSELTAAAKVPDMQVMQALGAALGRLESLQGEDGGWPTGGPAEAETGSERTLATNLALFALGSAKRAGVMGDDAPVKSGLAWLKAHTNDGRVVVGAATGLDRRSEAGRFAGAAAALTALNCVDRDAFLKDLVEVHGRYAKEIPAAPRCVPLHVWSAALCARQRGGGMWEIFYDDFRHHLVSAQLADGSFAVAAPDTPLAFESAVDGPAWRTALYVTALAAQDDRLPVLLARRTNPMQPAIDSDGETVEATSAPEGAMQFDMSNLPPGAQVIRMESMEDMQKMLEDMGIEGGDVQIMTTSGGKPKKKKDDDGEE